ncbi:hypothetical protein H696_00148 [Fonticula alba]|uniref:RUN domain-containing protein n=1 Tax=Fonticula alba TaxID=691883 RepID=A0A058ZGE5_FONAL|nr:hypothetical protein H696_00148 [Fonticula alba]KCV72557.1 hypothetical protein H696_00148 [Fonticula alba]|eukprot:XP_009492258.1 hypothetical protein H696_00148 [Fonticula alba]
MTGSSPPKSDASWLGLLYQSAAAEPVHAFAERAARATLQCASVCSGLSLPASFSPEDFHLPSPILIEDAEDLNSGGASVLALKSGLSRTLLSLELLLSHGLRPGLAVAADPNGRVPSFFSSLRMAAAGAAAPAAGATGPASGLLTFWDALATLGSAAGPLDGMPEQLPGSIESVAHMDHVGSSLGRLRAWLRKLLMEKSLGQFLRFLLTHEGFLRASYEPWAAVFSEEMTNILGLLDCFASFDLLFDLRTAHAGSPAPDADFFFALDELTKLSTGTKRPAAQTPGPVVGSDSTTSLAGLRGSVDSFHGLANRTNSYSPSPELDHLDFDDTLAGDMHHHQLHHHHHHHHHGDFLEEDRLAESQLERLSLGGGANDSSGANSDGEGAAAADLAEKHNHLTEELVMVRTQLESEQSLRTSLEQEVTRLSEELALLASSAATAVADAQEQLAEAKANERTASLELELQSATEQVTSLTADVKLATERTAALEADLQAAHERVAALEAEQAGQAEQLASSQAQLASAQAETQAVRQSLADTAAEASGRIAHLEGQVSMTTERFERLAKAFSAEKARLAQLTAENEELVRRVADQASAESSAPDAAPTEDTTELQSTKDRLAEVERERDNLLAQIQTQARELEDLSTERAAVTGALDKANWLIAALTDTAQVVECVPPGADGAEESEASEGGLLPLADGKSAASRRPVGEDDITDDEPEMEAPMSEGDDELESY